jgi:hypothetical protein
MPNSSLETGVPLHDLKVRIAYSTLQYADEGFARPVGLWHVTDPQLTLFESQGFHNVEIYNKRPQTYNSQRTPLCSRLEVKTEVLDDIISQYIAHGWVLRRAVLSENISHSLKVHLNDTHPGLEILAGSESGLWFSRRSLPDREAWELRRVSGSPFALMAVIEDSMSETEREAVLYETQMRMFRGSRPEPTSH